MPPPPNLSCLVLKVQDDHSNSSGNEKTPVAESLVETVKAKDHEPSMDPSKTSLEDYLGTGSEPD